MLVDDLLVGKTPLGPALLVDAGVHRVTLRRPGYLPRTSSVTLAGGEEQALSVALQPQPEEKTIVVREREVIEDTGKTWMIAGWITTGALAAGAVVTGIMGSSAADELEQLRRGLFGAAGEVCVFNAQQELPAGMTGQQPVEKGGACTPDVEIAGR